MWRAGRSRGGATGEVPQLREALPWITAEFERARRYERSVTVAVFSVAEEDKSTGAGGCDDPESLASVLASVVRQSMRDTDLVACDGAGRRCIVVMPEIGQDEGRRAVSRMRRLCEERLSCDVHADIAVFPSDGWMFPDLVEVAQRQARSVPKPPLAVPAGNPAI